MDIPVTAHIPGNEGALAGAGQGGCHRQANHTVPPLLGTLKIREKIVRHRLAGGGQLLCLGQPPEKGGVIQHIGELLLPELDLQGHYPDPPALRLLRGEIGCAVCQNVDGHSLILLITFGSDGLCHEKIDPAGAGIAAARPAPPPPAWWRRCPPCGRGIGHGDGWPPPPWG